MFSFGVEGMGRARWYSVSLLLSNIGESELLAVFSLIFPCNYGSRV